MTTPSSQTMAEEKLRKIIEAQVKGGCNDYSLVVSQLFEQNPYNRLYLVGPSISDGYNMHWHVLGILLDPKGLKAAYGEEMAAGMLTSWTVWKYSAHSILDAWLSGGAEKAINTAYNLLPL